jgi:hypothetical protein
VQGIPEGLIVRGDIPGIKEGKEFEFLNVQVAKKSKI